VPRNDRSEDTSQSLRLGIMLEEESGYTARNNVGHERRSFHGGIESLCQGSPRVTREVLEALDFTELVGRIGNEEDVSEFLWLFHALAKGNKQIAEKILNARDIGALIAKIQKEERAGSCAILILSIAYVDRNIAARIVDGLDTNGMRIKSAEDFSLRELADLAEEYGPACDAVLDQILGIVSPSIRERLEALWREDE